MSAPPTTGSEEPGGVIANTACLIGYSDEPGIRIGHAGIKTEPIRAKIMDPPLVRTRILGNIRNRVKACR